MCSGRVLVRPRMWPDTADTAPNSPIARAPHSSTPYSRPHLMLGRVTRKNIVQAFAPSERATTSSSLPCCCISGTSSRTTNGKVMNSVARTMPGRANRILTWCSRRKSANQPCEPNSSTRHRPATTGETAKGRSTRASSARLPRNSNRVSDQAANTPNTAFTGITIAAVNRVSLSAAIASGVVSAFHHVAKPLPKADSSTISSGSTTSSPITSTAAPISSRRSHAGVSRPCPACASAIAAAPALVAERQRDQVDRQQAGERGGQHQRRQRDRAVVVVLLEPDRDQQRRDLGLERLVAGDEDHRAVLAQRTREGEREPGQQRRQQLGQHHPAQGGQSRGAERGGGLLLLVAQGLEDRLHRAHRERQADEHQRDHDAGGLVGHLDAERL